jgi:hypothetical protein
LAACEVAKIGARVGAAKFCRAIYWSGKKTEQFAAVIGTSAIGCRVGRPDFAIRIRGIGKESIPNVLSLAQQALAEKPLMLDTQVNESDVLGISDHRVSPVLDGGYREVVTVRIDVKGGMVRDLVDPRSVDEVNDGSPMVGTIVSTDMLVNKLNTDQKSDWHLPSDAQQEAYLRGIKEALKARLSSICSDAAWLDDKTLSCRSSGRLRQ